MDMKSGSKTPFTSAQKWALVALVVGVLAPAFDSTIVTIATKVISAEMHASVSEIQWVVTAYLLALTVAIPVTGWAEGRFGGKRVWVTGLIVFTAGTIACAFAWDLGSLVTFRVIQGFGGGLITALMQTLAVQVAHGARILLVVVISIPMTVAPILGPVLGGLVLGWLDWRWIFLLNLPLLGVALLLAWRKLQLPQDAAAQTGKRLDVVGLLLIAPGLALCLLGFSRSSQDGGWALPGVWVPVVIGFLFLGGFTWWALRHSGNALIELSLLKTRNLAVATGVFAAIGATMYATMFLLPLFWQNLNGYTPLHAGLLLIPQGVGALLVRTFIGKVASRFSPRIVTALSFTLTAAATVPFAFATEHWSNWVLCGVLFVRGLGMGALMIAPMSVAYQGIPDSQYPDATMITRVSQQLGASVGVSVVAVALDIASRHSVADGFHTAFWWVTGMTAVAAAVGLLLPRRIPSSSGGMRM